MSAITKVAIAGATGNLGPVILNQLLNDGFKITVLTRRSSVNDLPSSVTVTTVDYDSVNSLTKGLKGQDAVISTISTSASAAQSLLVQAAGKAHVKRFIPAEFGSNTLIEKTRAIPVFSGKIAMQDALKGEAASSGMTYTLICTGPFLDWGIMVGFLLNLKEKSIDLLDGGNRPFSTTTLKTIGKAVSGVLNHPVETKNRAVYIQDTAITMKKLAAMAKQATGADGWKENVVPVDEVLGQAWAELKKDQPDLMAVFVNFVKAVISGEGYGSHYEKLDNELLGIKGMSDAEVQDVVNGLAA